jgi:hypothetical protein
MRSRLERTRNELPALISVDAIGQSAGAVHVTEHTLADPFRHVLQSNQEPDDPVSGVMFSAVIEAFVFMLLTCIAHYL